MTYTNNVFGFIFLLCRIPFANFCCKNLYRKLGIKSLLFVVLGIESNQKMVSRSEHMWYSWKKVRKFIPDLANAKFLFLTCSWLLHSSKNEANSKKRRYIFVLGMFLYMWFNCWTKIQISGRKKDKGSAILHV